MPYATERRLPIIGVMGSHEREWDDYAAPLGRLIAALGFHLLTGGGRGVMSSVMRSFCAAPQRRGLGIGIIPTEPDGRGGFIPAEDYPNPWVEVPIITPLPKGTGGGISRNHVNILTGDKIIALPGSSGTLDEVSLAINFNKPLMLFGPKSAFAAFPATAPHSEDIDAIAQFLRTDK